MARDGLKLVGKDLDGYRRTLFGAGADVREGKSGISREDAVRVLEKERGRLPLAVVLRCRVRYFSDGIVLGSTSFVEEHLSQEDGIRAKGARELRGADWGDLAVGTGLRNRLFS